MATSARGGRVEKIEGPGTSYKLQGHNFHLGTAESQKKKLGFRATIVEASKRPTDTFYSGLAAFG